MQPPDILAFDFDGVLCDGLPEYFWSSWQTYQQLWQPPSPTPPDALEAQFSRLRPVIETGWEMPLLIYALVHGIPENQILETWPQLSAQLLSDVALPSTVLAQTLDHIRDRAIQDHLPDWLNLHRFYREPLECLRSLLAPHSPTRPVIISTKEGRFIQELLHQQGVNTVDLQIFGKEVKCPKHQVLRELLATQNPAPRIWFIEDRLKTLNSIQSHPDLSNLLLYLAAWGYNTPQERQQAERSPTLTLLTLSRIGCAVSTWPTFA